MAETFLSDSLAWQLQILAYIEVILYTASVAEYIHLLPNEVTQVLHPGLLNISNTIYARSDTFGRRGANASERSYIKVPCLVVGLADAWVSSIASACSEFVFFLRTYALWQDNRVAKSFLVVIMTAYATLTLTVPAIIAREENIQLLNSHISFIPSCSLVNQSPNESKLTLWCLLGFLGFDFAMAILAKFKFGYRLGADSLTKKVYTDAIYYFSLNLLVAVASVLLYYESPGPFKGLVGESVWLIPVP
ncbi:hypothetical protein P691DRAFT_854010 [Macrolepiota fuliginosa MF-IS2]|uniref:Uncharacterized protein n=1 Tax=Macrolepiota fuliginosa MF-IS2 TaxID=1400762 RepID=A0A9P5WZR6_9AGAR|nr:hypothetical protein P691DRAFT_854010 [Macrolepiota fuliginosa MF-IS2]